MELRRSETKKLLINWHKSKGYIISWKKKKEPTKQFWVVLYIRKMGGLIEMNQKKTNQQCGCSSQEFYALFE